MEEQVDLSVALELAKQRDVWRVTAEALERELLSTQNQLIEAEERLRKGALSLPPLERPHW